MNKRLLERLMKTHFTNHLFSPLAKEFDSKDIYVIFSEARGGSTWLSELISGHLDSSVMWEPLHPKFGIGKLEWTKRPTLDSSYKDTLKNVLDRIFRGKVWTLWTISKNASLFEYRNKKRILIKFVRANRMINDILSLYRFDNKPIVLLRHPLAVFNSQFVRFSKDGRLSTEKMNLGFMQKDNEFLKHKDYVEGLKTPAEQDFALFCLFNKEVYSLKSDKAIIVYYENLVLDTAAELTKVFTAWGLNIPIRENLLHKPSSETSKEGLKQGSEQLRKWMSKYSSQDLEAFQAIMDHFGIVTYNAHSEMPQMGTLRS